MAMTSSVSIGGWAIWREYAFTWAVLIIASQVVSVIYKFLPFKSRIKPLSSVGSELSVLVDGAEHQSLEVAFGMMPEQEINDLRFSIRAKKTAIMKSAFSGMALPENTQLMRKAEQRMSAYFKSHYPELNHD
ncbi:hypothetical protein [Halopseudomonas sabulinigri]|uniref:hypothetical protein n=1 Tax=Halopseudomonas sabulinigri TaxID=472181 RepID=UPI001E2FFBAA|nr:hypothetical protein [Halopseudomonas sabulinigri]